MSELTVGPLAGPEAIPRVGTGEAIPAIPAGAERASERPIPGLDEFDRLELSAGPNLVQAYAKFTVHPDSGVVSIKIVDARTDQVIREIPPDEVLRIAEQLQAYMEAHKRSRR